MISGGGLPGMIWAPRGVLRLASFSGQRRTRILDEILQWHTWLDTKA